MLGSGNPTPYDLPAIIVLVLLGLTLLNGAILGPRWGNGVKLADKNGEDMALRYLVKLLPDHVYPKQKVIE
ncbi:MAG: hypothetical protein IPK22_14535 [Verrucomicrobiaceae bacterium]|nr:hypothetical protein [Verrucomicrobiaceae bacterium]